MMNEVNVAVPSAASTTPGSDLPPPGESNLPKPTAEQATISDRVFTTTDHATSLLGILTSAMLLRDVAVDTFTTSGEEDEAQEKPDPDKDADKAN